MTDDEVRLKALVDAMRNLGDPLSGTSLYQQAATAIESLSRDLFNDPEGDAKLIATVERDARADGESVVDAMARVVREARTACIDAGTYGAVGGDELEPLQAAIDALDALVIPDAIRALLPEPPRGEGES